jgi:hypothetical protein
MKMTTLNSFVSASSSPESGFSLGRLERLCLEQRFVPGANRAERTHQLFPRHTAMLCAPQDDVVD